MILKNILQVIRGTGCRMYSIVLLLTSGRLWGGLSRRSLRCARPNDHTTITAHNTRQQYIVTVLRLYHYYNNIVVNNNDGAPLWKHIVYWNVYTGPLNTRGRAHSHVQISLL